jgi:hypothetical protein
MASRRPQLGYRACRLGALLQRPVEPVDRAPGPGSPAHRRRRSVSGCHRRRRAQVETRRCTSRPAGHVGLLCRYGVLDGLCTGLNMSAT